MKKVLSVLLSVLMIFSIAQFGAVTAFADETTETVAEEGTTSNATGPVSGYREFSVECDYCGELFVEGEPFCPYCGKPVEEIIKAWEEKGNKKS